MARSKASARKVKSAPRDVHAEGKKVAAEKKKAKAKIKAKGKAKYAVKVAKQEQKRAAKAERMKAAAGGSEEDGEEPAADGDDGFIELDEDTDSAKADTHKAAERDEEAAHRALMLESMPWMGERKGYFVDNVYECLHEEIMDFVRFMSPTEDELARRASLIEEMKDIVAGLWPDATLETFGSHNTQMFLPQSDIDMVLFDVPTGKAPLFKLATALEELDWVSYLEVIDKARIPIVKLVHKATDIHVDVSFNVAGGLATADLVKHYMRVYPSFRPLTLVLKYFMAQRGLNETYSGGIGSFLLQLMVISYLQQYRRGLGPEHDDPKYNNLGQLLVGFLTLYGRDFNYDELGISVRNGGSYFYKDDRRWYDDSRPFLISMENPNEPSLDIGKNSYEIRTIKRAFDYARQVLVNEIQRRGQFDALSGSILGTIIPADGHLLAREAPNNFGFDILHHDPDKTAAIRQQYEARRDEEAGKKRAENAAKREAASTRRQNMANEPPYKRWRGRTSQTY
ncbi:hypothetical protein BBJ28_00008449 [Nothophytophthora sp. Chile5]|nr:hypothetical protein BBJ28_00008449 [Nothophytophthora sp. Chile5]